MCSSKFRIDWFSFLVLPFSANLIHEFDEIRSLLISTKSENKIRSLLISMKSEDEIRRLLISVSQNRNQTKSDSVNFFGAVPFEWCPLPWAYRIHTRILQNGMVVCVFPIAKTQRLDQDRQTKPTTNTTTSELRFVFLSKEGQGRRVLGLTRLTIRALIQTIAESTK